MTTSPISHLIQAAAPEECEYCDRPIWFDADDSELWFTSDGEWECPDAPRTRLFDLIGPSGGDRTMPGPHDPA